MWQSTRFTKGEHPDLHRLAMTAYPGYKGRKFKWAVFPADGMELNSYWDGGSRDTFAFVELRSSRSYAVASNHPFFEPQRPRFCKLPRGIACVEHSIFCGKDSGITIYLHHEDVPKLVTYIG